VVISETRNASPTIMIIIPIVIIMV